MIINSTLVSSIENGFLASPADLLRELQSGISLAALKLWWLSSTKGIRCPDDLCYRLIDLASSSDIAIKEIGYSSLAGSVPIYHEGMMLISNCLRKELLSNNDELILMGLRFLGSIRSKGVYETVIEPIISLISSSRINVKKRALCVLAIAIEIDVVDFDMVGEHLRDRLEETDPVLLNNSLGPIISMAFKDSDSVCVLIPRLVQLFQMYSMTNILLSTRILAVFRLVSGANRLLTSKLERKLVSMYDGAQQKPNVLRHEIARTLAVFMPRSSESDKLIDKDIEFLSRLNDNNWRFCAMALSTGNDYFSSIENLSLAFVGLPWVEDPQKVLYVGSKLPNERAKAWLACGLAQKLDQQEFHSALIELGTKMSDVQRFYVISRILETSALLDQTAENREIYLRTCLQLVPDYWFTRTKYSDIAWRIGNMLKDIGIEKTVGENPDLWDICGKVIEGITLHLAPARSVVTAWMTMKAFLKTSGGIKLTKAGELFRLLNERCRYETPKEFEEWVHSSPKECCIESDRESTTSNDRKIAYSSSDVTPSEFVFNEIFHDNLETHTLSKLH